MISAYYIIMRPLKFKPLLKQTIWGGDRILSLKHLDCNIENVGESWEISGVKGNESVVAEGEYEGMPLNTLVATLKDQLMGKESYQRFGDEFPLLVKFIDAHKDLSIQVHPNDEIARRHGKPRGKTEMWYVLEPESTDTFLYNGLAASITPQQYEAMVDDGTITQALARHTVSEGDVFFIPAGRIHAIGKGCLVAEIQQTSDVTYRIYDFKRKDKDGNYRQLHTKEAMECIDYSIRSNNRITYEKQENKSIEVVDCPYFKTSVCDVNGKAHFDYAAIDSFVIIIATKGNGTITDSEGNNMPLTAGETILLPATNKYIVAEGKMTLIETHV